MRKVTIFSTLTDSKEVIETSATTWGELRDEINEFNRETMRATVGSTKVTLDSTDAELPEGDFKLFLTPTKIKAGGEVRYTDAQIKELKTRLNNVFNDILDAYDEVDEDDTEDEELREEAEEIRRSLRD